MGQINFDGKLLADLGGFGKVNRLAVVLIQEEENKILAICKTSDSTGRTEADKVKEILDDWNLAEKIIAVGFDTTSSNTGVHPLGFWNHFARIIRDPEFPRTSLEQALCSRVCASY